MDPLIFTGLLLGAMIPYAFSALTMTAVGNVANDMIIEIEEQFSDDRILKGNREPDYENCIAICSRASFRSMIIPSLLVFIVPLTTGIFLGIGAVSGLITGVIICSIQLAISFSNSGGAWTSA